MTDVRAMFDRDYIGAWDLEGKDRVVVIDNVKAGELTSTGNKKTKKPIVFLQGKKKGFALNKTNMKIIAAMYGYDTRAWEGKRITLYPTMTTFGGAEMECIRVRPRIPDGGGQPAPKPAKHREVSVKVTPDGEIVEMTDEERAAAIDAGEA